MLILSGQIGWKKFKETIRLWDILKMSKLLQNKQIYRASRMIGTYIGEDKLTAIKIRCAASAAFIF